MKKLLLTNDDGLTAPGLTTLIYELLRTGLYELRVVAPEKEQSGVGHCITIHWPLLAESSVLPEPVSKVPAYHVAGTPADCVKLAITNLFPDFTPDLVVSGINRGPNVGMNVLYSGTVAGALEAVINGLPAVALSLDTPGVSNKGGSWANEIWHYTLAAELSVPIIAAALEHGLPEWTALNVNIPNRPQSEIRGVHLTRQGRSGFKEFYIEEKPEGSRRRFRLEGNMLFRDTDAGIDAIALREGWVSVSPLGLSLYSGAAADDIKHWNIFNALPG
jgi:5'-nucleotidase